MTPFRPPPPPNQQEALTPVRTSSLALRSRVSSSRDDPLPPPPHPPNKQEMLTPVRTSSRALRSRVSSSRAMSAQPVVDAARAYLMEGGWRPDIELKAMALYRCDGGGGAGYCLL